MPEAAEALYRPVEEIVPPLLTDQLSAAGLNGLPNWSTVVAVNCSCPPLGRVDAPGERLSDSTVEFTATVTLLVTVKPLVSVIVAWKT